MASYNVHGGHSLVCRGASGLLDEVNEDRKVKNKVIELLRNAGHTVYDCTDDDGETQSQNLSNIKNKCNTHEVDLDISIHLNAGRNDTGGDGKTGGVEVWNYSDKTKDISDRICSNISNALGITNRGTKYTKNLYILKKTNAPALLVECCFVDDKDDADHWNVDKCAQAIAEGVTGVNIESNSTSKPDTARPSVSESPAQISKINVVYQSYAKEKGWLSEIANYNNDNSHGYSGWFGYPILGLRAKTKGDASIAGYLEYRSHGKGGNWFGWRRDYDKDAAGDTYSGNLKREIDGLQFRIVGASGRHVRYRVHTVDKGWLSWITDYGEGSYGYAGSFGHAIDGVQIEIV